MPAMLMAMILAAAGQDVSTLRVPRAAKPTSSTPWNHIETLAEPKSYIPCPAPSRGELVSFDRLPPEVVADLRRTDPKMSPPGGPFNAGDTEDGKTPHTRIIAAMRLGGRLAVAYEKGGWGHSVTVLLYDADKTTGLMAVSGLHTLNPRETASGSVTAMDACRVLERAIGA